MRTGDPPPDDLYCKGRRPRALARQITRNWPGSEESVPFEPGTGTESYGERNMNGPTVALDSTSRIQICVSLWQLSPASAVAIHWCTNEASAMASRGRSAGRAANLAIRRYIRRTRRCGGGCISLGDHPWASRWIREQGRRRCVRQLAKGRGSNHVSNQSSLDTRHPTLIELVWSSHRRHRDCDPEPS